MTDVLDRAQRMIDYARQEGIDWAPCGVDLIGQMVSEIKLLRANQRHEALEPHLGKCRGIDD